MVLGDLAMVSTMVEKTDKLPYRARLREAMGLAEGVAPNIPDVKELARACGVEYQAVRKVFAGTTKAFSAETNSRAAAYLRVDSDWLATGEGKMRSERIWPFGTTITPDEFFSLPKDKAKMLIQMLAGAVKTEPQKEDASRESIVKQARRKAA